MAQTGFTPIVTYNTATATTVPSAANLAQGELAVNVTDKKLYTKDSGGNVVLLASNGGDVTGPASATDNAVVRFDATTGKLIQNSVVTIADTTGNMTGVGDLTTTGNAILGNASTDTLNVGNGGLIKDASGNVGVSVSPSTWSTGKAIEIGQGGCGIFSYAAGNSYFTMNCNYNTGWKYTASNYASYYQQLNGYHFWYTAPSGTAGNAITFTSIMTLDASGNLSNIGSITPSQTAGIIGTTTNNNANAGSVGEYISSTVLTASAVTINYGGSGVPVTSISLTAGDWDVTGWVGYNIAAGSVVTYLIQAISTNNTFLTGESTNVYNQLVSTTPQIVIPTQRVIIASTTTIYLSSATGGSGTALTAYGTIRARRIR